MATLSVKPISAVEYIKKLRAAKITEEQADIFAEVFEQQQQIIQEQNAKLDGLTNKDLATKGDVALIKLDIKELEVKIANIETRLIKWVFGVGISSVIVLCGAMFTMLKLLVH